MRLAMIGAGWEMHIEGFRLSELRTDGMRRVRGGCLARNVHRRLGALTAGDVTAGEVTSMNKSELIEGMVAKHPALPAHGVETAVNLVFDAIVETLAGDGRVEVRGFGSFSVRHRRAKQGRNPKTGASIAVPPKRVPFFIAGLDLARRVDAGRLKYPIIREAGE